jgi:hypothetical protein
LFGAKTAAFRYFPFSALEYGAICSEISPTSLSFISRGFMSARPFSRLTYTLLRVRERRQSPISSELRLQLLTSPTAYRPLLQRDSKIQSRRSKQPKQGRFGYAQAL